jgi:hypothetical protein
MLVDCFIYVSKSNTLTQGTDKKNIKTLLVQEIRINRLRVVKRNR